MKKLDIVHHNLIVLFFVLFVLITGIYLGVKLSIGTQGTDGMIIIVFSLCFLITSLQFIIFTQLTHLRDDIQTLQEAQQKHTKK